MGDAGVGKTAIAEGLALKIVRGEVPRALAGSTVYSLDMGSLLAGFTRYPPETFEGAHQGRAQGAPEDRGR